MATDLGPYAQNMTQQQIIDLQNGLIKAGYPIPAIQNGTATPGYYGKQTFDAVAAWQKANGVSAGTNAGYWGPLSQNKLTSLGGWTAPTGGGEPPVVGTPPSDTTPPTYDPNTYAHYGSGTNLSAEDRSKVMVNAAESRADLNNLVGDAALAEIMNDSRQLAFYVHAVTYGGYKLEDVVKDMKAFELRKTNPSTPQIISAEQTRADYYASDAGKTVLSFINSTPDLSKINADSMPEMSFLRFGREMPDAMFKTLTPLNNPDSPEYKAAIEAVKSTQIDLSNALLNANTDQEYAFAKSQYDEFRKQIKEKYGVMLSDDATKAQVQMDNLGQQFEKYGAAGSGRYDEAVDKMLKSVRRGDDVLRTGQLNEEESKKAAYYRQFASSAEIAALTPEERTKYGLTASPDIIQKFSLTNLRALYPEMTDKEIQSLHDAVIDDSTGTPVLRSDLYQKKYSTINTNETTRAENARTEVATQAVDAGNQIRANYDDSEPFSTATPKDTAQVQKDNPVPPVTSPDPVVSPKPVTSPTTSTSNYQAQIDAMMAQAQQIQQGINAYKAGNTQPTTTASYTAPTNTATTSGYTFKPSGTNVEIWQNGTRISTASPSYAKSAYGYTG